MRISRFVKLKAEALPLTAYFDLEMPSGLCIKDCKYYTKENRCWFVFPSKMQKDKAGKAIYSSYIAFTNNDVEKRFISTALELVKMELQKT